MMTYPETSFLCALYVQQNNSTAAISYIGGLRTPLVRTSLLSFEFRQSVQFQVFRQSKDRTQGYPLVVAQSAMAAYQSDIKVELYRHAAVDWADVHRIAERLALQHTMKRGHRSLDILHVATALHLGAAEFLTFDSNQRKLAKAEGLRVPL